jgi:hypothetical protein
VENARVDGLEVDEDLEFQRKSWTAERVGWVVMALFVLAAAAGLLGSGPLGHATAGVPGVMAVDYERFARLETSETLTIRLEPAAIPARTVRLSLSREFLDGSKVVSILPAPERVESAAGRLVFVFAVAEPRTPMVVTFNVEPQQFGRSQGIIGLESLPEPRFVTFRQLVYP